MRVLALSPGPLQEQLSRLPALARLCSELNATLQVACAPACRTAWELLPAMEKIIPIDFDTDPTMADWANLLGSVREPDFQICLNFAEGRQVNLMLSMSHIPTRIGRSGFACTEQVNEGDGWAAQQLAPWLRPLGIDFQADAFRLTLPQASLDEVRSKQPPGDGPLLLLAPSGSAEDWPEANWAKLPATIQSRLESLRSVTLPPTLPFSRRAAAVACADVVLSSCPVTQLLAIYCSVPLVALGPASETLPERSDLRCLGHTDALANLSEHDVLSALGF